MSSEKTKNSDEKYCSECAAIIKSKAEICPHCGCRQSAPPLVAPVNKKSRLVAAALSFFFGAFGIQFLYIRKYRWMLIPLICMLPATGIYGPVAIGIMWGIIFMFQSDESFDADYNTPKADKSKNN